MLRNISKNNIVVIASMSFFALLILSINIAHAASSGRFFGGRIVETKALKIEILEDSEYECEVPGSTIEIETIGSPKGTPTSYFISAGTKSKTNTKTRNGQLIIGKYSGKTTITCIRPEPEDIQTVVLDTITMYGTSK